MLTYRGISEIQIHKYKRNKYKHTAVYQKYKYKRNTNVNIPKTVAFVSNLRYLPRPDVHILTYDLC